MTHVTILQDKKGSYLGFSCRGHAGYGKAGEDIVCSAISVLTINTVNSISSFTDTKFFLKSHEKKGQLKMLLKAPVGDDAALLMKSLVLGLQEIQDNYKDYMILNFKEV